MRMGLIFVGVFFLGGGGVESVYRDYLFVIFVNKQGMPIPFQKQ